MINIRQLLLLLLISSPATQAMRHLANETPQSYLSRFKRKFAYELVDLYNVRVWRPEIFANTLLEMAKIFVQRADTRLTNVDPAVTCLSRISEEDKPGRCDEIARVLAAVVDHLNVARAALTTLRRTILNGHYSDCDWIDRVRYEFNQTAKDIKGLAARVLDERPRLTEAKRTIAVYQKPDEAKKIITKIKENQVSCLIYHVHDLEHDADSLCKLLAEALKNDKNLHTLELHSDSLGEVGVIAIAEMLTTNTGLKNLSIKGKPYTENGAQALLASLKSNQRPINMELSYATYKNKHGQMRATSTYNFLTRAIPPLKYCGVSQDTQNKIIRQLRFNNEYPQFWKKPSPDILELLCCSWEVPTEVFEYVMVPIWFALVDLK